MIKPVKMLKVSMNAGRQTDFFSRLLFFPSPVLIFAAIKYLYEHYT